jgi:hypothetical protein
LRTRDKEENGHVYEIESTTRGQSFIFHMLLLATDCAIIEMLVKVAAYIHICAGPALSAVLLCCSVGGCTMGEQPVQ